MDVVVAAIGLPVSAIHDDVLISGPVDDVINVRANANTPTTSAHNGSYAATTNDRFGSSLANAVNAVIAIVDATVIIIGNTSIDVVVIAIAKQKRTLKKGKKVKSEKR